MSDIPGFFDSFKKEAVQRYYQVPEAPEPKVAKKTFTYRDWEVLQAVLAHTRKNDFTPSNSQLGEVLGMTNGQVSARIKRLVELGCLGVSYEHWSDTGKQNRRTIKVREVPAKPWRAE